MTFSLVARCAQTGMFGASVAFSSHALAGVGAVASWDTTDPTRPAISIRPEC